MDPVMPYAVGGILLILVTGIILKLLKQPHIVAYLIAGILIGPWGLGMLTNSDDISRLGAAGVVLLLFFVGMETDAKKLIANWKLAIFGTVFQIGLSILCIALVGIWFDWSDSRIIFIGFVISLSSTAVVIKLLQDSEILDSKVGQGVLSILLAQDLAIIPMLIVLGLLGEGKVESSQLIKQGLGAIGTLAFLAFIISRKSIHLPLAKWLKEDRELQLFTALGICFGLSLVTAWLELSTALGAFIAGMVIAAVKETQWVHHTLESFKVLFIALFFVSIGMLLDLNFLATHWSQAIALVLAVLVTNTFINASILKLAKFNLKDSLYAGIILSQIGEFSFVLAAVGLQSGIINDNGYQLAICVIALSLLVSPMWINIGKKLLKWEKA